MIDEYIVDYDDYVGVGSGSFGYFDGKILANTFSLNQYSSFIDQGKIPFVAKKEFSQKEQMRYDFLMKLFGGKLVVADFREKYKGDFYRYLWTEILFFKLVGGITTRDGTITLTRKGLYFWVIMMREFFTAVNNFRDYCRNQVENAQ